jgi:membrane protein YdbS with pleckstrin-like domain
MLLKNIPIEPSQLPNREETLHHGHPPQFRRELFFLTGLPFIILLGGPVTLYILNIQLAALLSLLAWGLLLLLSFYGVYRSFPIRGYALRELDISYKKGWIFFSHITIPFNRVQHSEISQGPVDRYFGLVTLNIYTAGGSSSDLSIPGLEREEAQRLRDFISTYHD